MLVKTLKKLSFFQIVLAVAILTGLLGAMAYGIGYGVGRFGGPDFVAGLEASLPHIITLAVLIGGGTGLYVGYAWWQGLDEAVKESHKWAWYWGGSWGLLLGFTALFALALRPGGSAWAVYLLPHDLQKMFPHADLSLLAGGWTMVLFMISGYLIAWGMWWLRHR